MGKKEEAIEGGREEVRDMEHKGREEGLGT